MISRRARQATLVVAVACALLLTGCWDRKGAEDIAFVTAIGLDAADDGRISVTVAIANPRAIAGQNVVGGGGSDMGVPSVVQRLVQPTMTEALRDLETFTNRRISLVHTKVILFGEELAKQGLQSHLGILTRFRELRRNVRVMMVAGKAQKLLTTRPVLERDPSLFLEDLSRRAEERTARAPNITLHDFLVGVESLAEQAVLPVIKPYVIEPGLEEQQTEKARMEGTAILHKDRVVGVLSPDDTEVFLLLTGNARTFTETIPEPTGPGHKIAFVMHNEKTTVQVDTTGKVPRFRVTVSAEADLRESERARPDLATPEAVAEMEQRLSRQLTLRTNELVKRMQQEFQSDIFGYGKRIRARFLDWPSWQSYNWPERFPTAQIQVSVRVHLRRIGMTFQPVHAR